MRAGKFAHVVDEPEEQIIGLGHGGGKGPGAARPVMVTSVGIVVASGAKNKAEE